MSSAGNEARQLAKLRLWTPHSFVISTNPSGKDASDACCSMHHLSYRIGSVTRPNRHPLTQSSQHKLTLLKAATHPPINPPSHPPTHPPLYMYMYISSMLQVRGTDWQVPQFTRAVSSCARGLAKPSAPLRPLPMTISVNCSRKGRHTKTIHGCLLRAHQYNRKSTNEGVQPEEQSCLCLGCAQQAGNGFKTGGVRKCVLGTCKQGFVQWSWCLSTPPCTPC